LPGRFHDATQTRAQVLRTGLELVRSEAGEEAFLFGCGCPLGPAIGLVNGMRIGADTARRWNPYFKGIKYLLRKEVSFPSAFNALHNTLTRADLHGRWWINDPDCLLLRPETELTKTEVETIASVIALSGGSLMISDHVPDLPPERLNILKVLLPLIGKRPYILDWFDSTTPERVQLDLDGPSGPWHLVALFNWKEAAQDKFLKINDFYLKESQEMYARDFWMGKTHLIHNNDPAEKGLAIEQIPPHGVVLLALRPRHPYTPQYLGSNLHISQGLEVCNWWPHDKSLEFELERPGNSHGQIELAIPGQVEEACSKNARISWESGSHGIYSFELEFKNKARIEIKYS